MRLGRSVERRARAHEHQVIAIEHARLLRRERKRVAAAVKRIDASKQRLIHKDVIPVLGLERRQVALNREDRIVRVGAGEHVEHVLDAGERGAA